jgi:hypothetical protein
MDLTLVVGIGVMCAYLASCMRTWRRLNRIDREHGII